jgi:hypothetical protein
MKSMQKMQNLFKPWCFLPPNKREKNVFLHAGNMQGPRAMDEIGGTWWTRPGRFGGELPGRICDASEVNRRIVACE